MKQILILGAGFGGVACARELARQFGNGRGAQITVIDKNSVHWFHADLYEIASSPEEVVDRNKLQNSVAIPLADIFHNTGIAFIKGEVTSIDAAKSVVYIGARQIPYDYLICALGSQVSYNSVPGAKEYGLPLKTFADALRIRNAVEFLVQRHRTDTTKRRLEIIIAGGGFSGSELAAELVGCLDFVCWKNGYPREKVELTIMEAMPRILPGLPEKASHDAHARLTEFGVHVQTGSSVVSVDDSFVQLKNGERVAYDCLIWTAGVESADVPFVQYLQADKCKRVMVSDYLQVNQYHNVFFIGDQSCIASRHDSTTANAAIAQGRYVARVLPRLMLNHKPMPYVSKEHSFVVPLGKKFAIYSDLDRYTAGYFGYVIKIWRTFMYYSSLLGFFRALVLLIEKQWIYSKND